MITFLKRQKTIGGIIKYLSIDSRVVGVLSLSYDKITEESADKVFRIVEDSQKYRKVLADILEEGVLSRELMMRAHQLIYPELHKTGIGCEDQKPDLKLDAAIEVLMAV